MCGIVGIAGQHDLEWLRHMNSTLRHRGPDDQGQYQSPDGLVSLAMRRWSIIDLQNAHPGKHNDSLETLPFFQRETEDSSEKTSFLYRIYCLALPRVPVLPVF
jgi:hypothetical protein